MNTTLKLCAVIYATTLTAAASNAATLECIQSGISVAATNFNEAIIDGREITIEVTNNLEFALGGVWVDYEIWAAERPTPIYSASIREAATIKGALLPGETLTASDFHFMDERAIAFARATTDLTIQLHVENAADADMNGFLQHPAMGSWTGMLTEQPCQSPDQQ